MVSSYHLQLTHSSPNVSVSLSVCVCVWFSAFDTRYRKMGSWRWSSTPAFYPSYCRCHAPLSLHKFSFSTPSSTSSFKISTGIKARLQLQHYNKKTTTNNNVKNRKNFTGFKDIIVRCTSDTSNTDLEEKQQEQEAVGFDSVSTGQDNNKAVAVLDENSKEEEGILELVWEWAVLVSPFFFWGTAMVAMKEVIPKYGPFFVSAFRTIPAGFLLIAFAASRARPFPSGLTAWLSITLFALVDAACFQVITFTYFVNKFCLLLVMTYGSDGGHRAFLLKGYRRHRLVWVAYVFPQFTLNCCFVEFLLHFYSF